MTLTDHDRQMLADAQAYHRRRAGAVDVSTDEPVHISVPIAQVMRRILAAPPVETEEVA